ncbi:kinase-like domain-containing protein [Cladorrhinum sp. PSN332]|nr:kinase-like domain-containing protein [Cladorrhinum sp. PSN332]
MATSMGTRRRPSQSFRIHEDAPSTEDAEMNEQALRDREEGDDEDAEPEEAEAQESEYSESSDDEPVIDTNIQQDMERLQNSFPGFRFKYRLIKRIGEGTFSTVYKAEDLQYDSYDNSWDLERVDDKWTPPPLKSFSSHDGHQVQRRRKPKFVAIKKIYVTSSPTRILNELELLYELRGCQNVCPLITAFRATDQVVAILPYFRHADFREYFRKMTVQDMAIYLRSLFSALASVHALKIMHRDIKPTNFLYDPESRRGVLVDFGLAEREGTEWKPCACSKTRKIRAPVPPRTGSAGYPKQDSRPSRRANRAGTRGFRAPEVLFKCTEQTTQIDIWSVGVILLTILSRRFPFFNSADDVEAMIEISTIFGQRKMKEAAKHHGCNFETTIPTIGTHGFTFERIILWSTCRSDSGDKLSAEEKMAVEFLEMCLQLDPEKRITAKQALKSNFLRMGMETTSEGSDDDAEEDEMDLLKE